MRDAEQKRFRVTTVLSVRTAPNLNGARLPESLQPGVEIDVEADSRQEVDGFVWWKHNAGWSAERRIDGAQIFMEPVMVKTAQTGTAIPAKYYRVTRSLSVRAQPGLNGQRLPDPLEPDTEIEIDPESRQEVDGFIWWKHGTGWSAERSTDGAHIFMEPLTSSPASPKTQDAKPEASASSSTSTDRPEALEKTAQTGRRRAFKVMQALSVRAAPGLTAQRLPDVLPVGTLLDCDEDSRCEVDGFVW